MNNAKESWKVRHWRVLEYGPQNEIDWPIAKDLIGQGYADGAYRVDASNDDKILSLQWKGVTPSGQWYLKWLRQEIEQIEPPEPTGKEFFWLIAVVIVFLVWKLLY